MLHRLHRFPGKLHAPIAPASRPLRSWKHATWGFAAGTGGILAVTGVAALISVHDHAGWLFPLLPVTLGATILVAIAVVANNIVNHRQYPKHWW